MGYYLAHNMQVMVEAVGFDSLPCTASSITKISMPNILNIFIFMSTIGSHTYGVLLFMHPWDEGLSTVFLRYYDHSFAEFQQVSNKFISNVDFSYTQGSAHVALTGFHTSPSSFSFPRWQSAYAKSSYHVLVLVYVNYSKQDFEVRLLYIFKYLMFQLVISYSHKVFSMHGIPLAKAYFLDHFWMHSIILVETIYATLYVHVSLSRMILYAMLR